MQTIDPTEGSPVSRRSIAGEPGAFRKLPTFVWTDARYVSLGRPPPCPQWLLHYLITGPFHLPAPGFVSVGKAALAERLGWTVDELLQQFRELEERDIALADWDTGFIWLPDVTLGELPANLNVVKHWYKAVTRVIQSELLTHAILALKTHIEKVKGKSFVQPFQTLIDGTKQMKRFRKRFRERFVKPLSKSIEVDRDIDRDTDLRSSSAGGADPDANASTGIGKGEASDGGSFDQAPPLPPLASPPMPALPVEPSAPEEEIKTVSPADFLARCNALKWYCPTTQDFWLEVEQAKITERELTKAVEYVLAKIHKGTRTQPGNGRLLLRVAVEDIRAVEKPSLQVGTLQRRRLHILGLTAGLGWDPPEENQLRAVLAANLPPGRIQALAELIDGSEDVKTPWDAFLRAVKNPDGYKPKQRHNMNDQSLSQFLRACAEGRFGEAKEVIAGYA